MFTLAWLSSAPSAATLSVGPTQTYLTIRDAIAAAAPGDEIVVDPGAYFESLDIAFDLTVRGSAPGAALIRNGGVTVDITGGNVRFESMIVDGDNAKGFRTNGGGVSLTLVDVELFDAKIAIDAEGPLTILDSFIHDNGGDAWYGAVNAWGDSVYISGSTFLRNETDLVHPDPWSGEGGAVYVSTTRRAVIVNNHFEANASRYRGGALYVFDHANLRIEGNTFCENTSSLGGAIAFDGGNSSRGHVRNNVFIENSVEMNSAYYNQDTGRGGAIWIDGGNMRGIVVFANSFAGNSAENGGAHVYLSSRGNPFQLDGNLFAFGARSASVDTVGANITGNYNAWWSNSRDMAGSFAVGANDVVGVDPMVTAFTSDGDCGNDDLTPLAGSPLIDAGNPILSDSDGSVADIGFTGGR